MKRGFSLSTAVLVAVLLGVVVWVGRIVNPPAAPGGHDHNHAEESGATGTQAQAKPTAAQMAAHKAQMENQQKMQMKMMKEHMEQEKKMSKMAKGTKAPAADPMDASYWQNHEMGASAATPDEKPH